MSDQTKLTIDYSLVLRYLVVVIVVVLGILVFIPISITIKFSTVLLIVFYYLWVLLLNGTPHTILINQDDGTLTIISFRLFARTEEKYNSKDLECTYQDEIGARGGKVMVFKVSDRKGRILLKILPNFNGWSNEKLSMIYKALNSR